MAQATSTIAFVKHRPVDRSDPGFTIPGHRLRWVSARVSENEPGRPWRPLRKSQLSKELQDHLETINPDVFAHGDTIRKGDLVLALAHEDRAKELRKELNERSRDQERSVARFARGVNNPDGSPRAKVDINEDKDATALMARFKATKED